MFPQIFGKYVLEREIGAGGMARVFQATLRGAGGFEKRLVVKQIRAELASDSGFVERFVEEAKIAVELSHPNIVPVYELGVEQGVYYIAMELCEGVTLSEILAAGRLEPAEAAYVGVEICRALDYAHRRAGIVHRDVTPRNVLIDEEGAVRLIDFGIAAPVRRADESGRREVFGSPGHMPPEQLEGKALSPATDVFAAGVLLYEACSGQAPFRRSTPAECARALREVPRALSEVSGDLAPLAELVQRALALAPAERPQTADDLSRPLREYLKAADLGDVARRLGERARALRARGRPSRPPPPADDGTTPPANATPQTRTFAARDEWSAWTRPIEDGEVAPEAVVERPQAGSGPATRRLSQPPTTAGGPARTRTQGGRLIALGVALAAAAALMLALRRPAPVAARSTAVSSVPSVTVSAAPGALASSSSPAPTLVASAEKVPLPRSPASVPRVASAALPGSSGGTALQNAILRLTADPPAAVSIDGDGTHESRTTPVSGLALRPGRYRLTFRNETYGAPVTTVLNVGPGETRSAHADFRAVEPSISVR